MLADCEMPPPQADEEVNNSNSWCSWKGCCFLVLKTAPVIKSLAYLIIIALYCYLRARSARTDDFSGDKDYCIADKSTCQSKEIQYSAAVASLDEPPYCYISDKGPEKGVCISNEMVEKCLEEYWSVHSGDFNSDISIYASDKEASYFPFDFFILILCFTSLLFTQCFEISSGNHFVEDETSFISRNEILKVTRFNAVLGITNFSLIIWSSQTFNLMKEESCTDNTHNFANDFCLNMVHCNTGIRSVVNTEDPLISNYSVIAICCACFLVLTVLLSCCRPNFMDHNNVYARNARDENERNENTNEAVDTLIALFTSELLNLEHDSEQIANRRLTPAIELTRPAIQMRNWKWKRINACGGNAAPVECAICLEVLSGVADTDSFTTTFQAKRKYGKSKRPSRSPQIAPTDDASNDQESLNQEIQWAVQLPCAHCFHESCIIQWSKSHQTCPNCRANLSTGFAISE